MTALAAAPMIDRNRLIADHLTLVQHIARQLNHGHDDFDDLVADGHEGLVKAARDWDPNGGSTFQSYAWVRIRGHMIDGLRARDPLTRMDRSYAERIEQTRLSLAQRDGHTPTFARLAKELGWTERQLSLRQARIAAQLTPHPLNRMVKCDDGEILDAAELMDPDPSANVIATVELRDQTRTIIALLGDLTEQERIVIALALWDRTQREIGITLGVSESRVSQIRHAALGDLRQGMGLVVANVYGTR